MSSSTDLSGSTELALRCLPRLEPQRLLVGLPFTADAAKRIRAVHAQTTVWHHDHAAWQADPGDRVFDAYPPEGQFDTGLLFLPKERELGTWAMQAMAARLTPTGHLLVVGPNRGGIRAAGKAVATGVGPVLSVSSGNHCRAILAGASEDARLSEPPPLPSLQFPVTWAETTVQITSYPGVFAHGTLDAGTALLLDALTPDALSGPILDWGCGAGVIGVALSVRRPDLVVDLVDCNAFALAAARASCIANAVDPSRVQPSDGFSGVVKRYANILTNPPFHAHIRQDTAVTEAVLAAARSHLLPGGRLTLVANRFLEYPQQLKREGAEVNVLAETDRFRVIEARW